MLENDLAKTRVAPDLTRRTMTADGKVVATSKPIPVIIELNADFPGGAIAARMVLLRQLLGSAAPDPVGYAFETVVLEAADSRPAPTVAPARIHLPNSMLTDRYVFAELTPKQIWQVADATATLTEVDPETRKTEPGPARFLVHRIWPDETIKPLVYVSSRTIKGDAARAAFNSMGAGIVWAVADTGVADHPHFRLHENLVLKDGLEHWDFTGPGTDREKSIKDALTDTAGHGTHVAGIIAGRTMTETRRLDAGRSGPRHLAAAVPHVEIEREPSAGPEDQERDPMPEDIPGVAPQCKIMSLKVLETTSGGKVSALIAAINYIQRINGNGRHVKVHGLNISLGYDFNVKQYAAGQSPLCAEVDRLVRGGVVVVVAAGNGGGGVVARRAARRLAPACSRPSPTPATPTWRSPSARPTATSRIPTASRSSRPRARRWTAG